jgi:CRP/FNR family cyclic AMP-dependent transcriptional regulator
MYIQQSDLFWGMDRDFVKTVMDIAVKESRKGGDFLFRKGDNANHFYILLTGRVKLAIGEVGGVAYIVDRAGEAFGWSSLAELDSYSASAECMEATTLKRIERQKIQQVLESDPANGLLFFKRLAGIIGNRLLWSYEMLTASAQAESSISFGTEQVQESEAVR